jgi:NitT/TauT family transport system ATP-binding protein
VPLADADRGDPRGRAAPERIRFTVAGVSKQFDTGSFALRDVNLRVPDGTFVSILGPSGCGKSTLLRLIAGLTTPSAGTITWRPEDPLTTIDPNENGRPALGFVFQEPTLLPWSTVLANVMLPMKLKGQERGAAEATAAATLQRVGLAGFEKFYPRQLSGGMRMRVSIARALVTKPRVLLMDEPFAALDEITRHKLNDDLLALWWQQRFTAVFVTHSVFESVYLSQRIAVMAARPGRIVADLNVATPYPRDDLFRTSAAYAQACRTVSDALKKAIEA